MGQRRVLAAARRTLRDAAAAPSPRPVIPASDREASRAFWRMAFPTELGWIGVLGSDRGIARLTLGHASLEDVRRALRPQLLDRGADRPIGDEEPALRESDGNPDLRRRLERYARGERVDFGDVRIDRPPVTVFQERILETTRGIAYGETLTYAELAARAGQPGAARAVGNVMASNRVPLIIPCHRVVAAGKLGGYSAPQGVELKKRLLGMERGEPQGPLSANGDRV